MKPNKLLVGICYGYWIFSIVGNVAQTNLFGFENSIGILILIIVPPLCSRAAVRMAKSNNGNVNIAFFLGFILNLIGVPALWIWYKLRRRNKK